LAYNGVHALKRHVQNDSDTLDSPTFVHVAHFNGRFGFVATDSDRLTRPRLCLSLIRVICVCRLRTGEPVVLESAEPVEKIVGELLGAAGKVVGTGIKTVGGAASGAAAGLTGSKQNIDWGGGEKSVDEDDEETSVKKSTDIFKRVLEAERPDETWTGTDKEKEVPMEKIVGALLAPVAGLAGGIAGGAAKKIIGG